jgi:hypothetical protein
MKHLALLTILLALASVATAGGYQHSDDPEIDVDVTNTDSDTLTQDQTQDQSQEQDQDQLQEQSQSQSSDQANSQSISFENRTPGRAFVGGGDSTAADQKVFAVSGGWLTGAMGFRLDLTDRDSRKLRIAEQWRADGRVAAADKLTCSIKAIYKPFGSADECYTVLAGSAVTHIVDGEKALKQAELDELRKTVEQLQRQMEMQDEKCDRQWESCVRSK